MDTATLVSWKGPVVAIAGGEKYFGAVERRQVTADDGDGTPTEFAVGDCVLLAGGAGEIVHVLAMWEAREGGAKRAELYESDRVAEVDIATAFERCVSVGTTGSNDEFIVIGMLHVKTRRVAPLGTSGSRMQRSRTLGFRVQMMPSDESGADQSNERKRQRTGSGDSTPLGRANGAGSGGAAPSIDPVVLQKLQRACEELQLSSLPKVMTGRDHERSEIYNALRSSIHAQRAGGPIYISGLPGVGKTSIVKEIIKNLETQRAAGTLPRFVWIEVNGLHIPKPDVAYSVVWKALQEGGDVPRFMNPAKMCAELQHTFHADDPERPILVVLIDEMDFLLAGKNEVLYNLLEWQTFATAKLLIIGIANTMDLPERLAPKIRSRLGGHRITFPPYSKSQLEEIIEQRLAQLDVFSKEAIQVCAKSLAHKSGDVRQALAVCRKAVEVCIRRLSQSDTSAGAAGGGTGADMYVTEQDLQHAQQAVSVSAPMSRLRACSKFECIFVIALQMEVKMKDKQEGEFDAVVNRFAILCKTYSFAPIPRLRGFIWICDELERSGIIRQIRSKSSRYPRLELRCSSQEIHE
ncbi:hypothetical protein PybrP1_005689, partial [[Pythium] brassicae (nom. inval.)]